MLRAASNARGKLRYHVTGSGSGGSSGNFEYLVIAGGGGGGSLGGGGGAGGYLEGTIPYPAGQSGLTVTVGTGGNGGAAGTANPGANGTNSVFSTFTAIGGGGGGGYSAGAGGNGGSGGGAQSFGGTGLGGTGTAGQGNNGGTSGTNGYGAGGGGGAGAVGGNAVPAVGGSSGNGGAGRSSSITGAAVTRAGGGGGGGRQDAGNVTPGTGGSGGGGGGDWNAGGSSGTANTGGGGGGGGYDASTVFWPGGNGGSGVVILAYPETLPAATFSGVTATQAVTRPGFRVYSVTSGTGTVTFPALYTNSYFNNFDGASVAASATTAGNYTTNVPSVLQNSGSLSTLDKISGTQSYLCDSITTSGNRLLMGIVPGNLNAGTEAVIEFWFRRTGADTFPTLFHLIGGTASQEIYFRAGGTSNAVGIGAAVPVADNSAWCTWTNWNKFTIRINAGTGNVVIFCNNTQVATGTIPVTWTAFAAGNVQLSFYQFANSAAIDNGVSGYIDNLQIYNV